MDPEPGAKIPMKEIKRFSMNDLGPGENPAMEVIGPDKDHNEQGNGQNQCNSKRADQLVTTGVADDNTQQCGGNQDDSEKLHIGPKDFDRKSGSGQFENMHGRPQGHGQH